MNMNQLSLHRCKRCQGGLGKKRVRAFNEPVASGNKISKKRQAQQCSMCKKTSPNKTRRPNKAPEFLGNSTSSNVARVSNRPKKMQPRRPYQTPKQSVGCHVDWSSA